MLELRPNCECCGKALPPASRDAVICSFECTFCRDCQDHRLPGGLCPNCEGELVARPVRPVARLAQYPASDVQKVMPHSGCARD
ncbi:MAG: DUF1272 domain-containing protein [Hyphomicrobium sp.]|nr:DUF1272 domain-containing protein [Hyphomicrobium sp.]